MSDVIVSVEGLGKRYSLRHEQGARYRSLREELVRSARALLPAGGSRSLPDSASEEFWALRDVSFDLKRGEILGVIGRNGAGKSTLLKVLSRITEPSEGRVRMRGRVASLLEVGTGFHPELTGRENIFLNGAVLGMKRSDVMSRFDEIVSFAEVERFLDTPVKKYSSGMYMRLAFAVAAHLEQDILVVDEVLATGDAEFQRRCLGKMKDVTLTSGRTVLFVSHNMAAVQALCAKTLRLDAGRSLGVDNTRKQVETYIREVSRNANHGAFGVRRLSENLLLDDLTFSPDMLEGGREAEFQLALSSKEDAVASELCLLVYSLSGGRVSILDLRDDNGGHRFGPGRPLNIRGRIRSVPLVEGEYSVGLYLNASDVQAEFLDLASFTVMPSSAGDAKSKYPAQHRGVLELSFDFART